METLSITLTPDEAFVLYDFFSRFDETDHLRPVHDAEFAALAKISGPIEKSCLSLAIKNPQYSEQLSAARHRIAAGNDWLAPCVQPENGGTLRKAWCPPPEPVYIRKLQAAIQERHHVEAAWLETIPVAEHFRHKKEWRVWEGTVELFELRGHPGATRCYAFESYDLDLGQLAIIFEQPPVSNAHQAVKHYIEEQRKERRAAYGLSPSSRSD